MKELTNEQFATEMKTFEGLCNKAQIDLKSYIDGCSDNELKEKLQKRYDGFEQLINYVASDTNFISAPASTRYHLCIPHGLLIHSNSVTKTLLKLNEALNSQIPKYQCITCGLLHDLGKEDDYEVNPPTEKQKAAGYKANPPYLFKTDGVYNEHECQSIYVISKFIDLTEEEHVAIMYHNSPWDGNTKCAFRKNKLMTMLQNADYWSSVYLEDRPD